MTLVLTAAPLVARADGALGLAEMAVVIVAARLRCTPIVTFDEEPLRRIRPPYGDAFTLHPADA